MIKVFQAWEYSIVGHLQSLLETEGIATDFRNRDLTQLGGAVPMTEVWPELWVVNDEDADAAREIIEKFRDKDQNPDLQAPWKCPKCGEIVDGNFGECWNCGGPAPALPVAG